MADNFDENCCDQVTLTLDDGQELLCDILAIFPCGEKEYIALVPADGDENSDIFLYGFKEGETENDMELIDIESDEEFEEASEAFDEFLDSQEWEELYGDEDDAE